MSNRYCPECGQQNPAGARFCMQCGYALAEAPAQAGQLAQAGPAARPGSEGTDWAGIVAAVLAFLSLRRMSPKARGMTLLVVFLVLFFGCPMVCGFVGFVMEWAASLFR
jgi:uncharacterized membrane protein YvbJ